MYLNRWIEFHLLCVKIKYMLQDQELEEAIADAVDIGEKEVLGGGV